MIREEVVSRPHPFDHTFVSASESVFPSDHLARFRDGTHLIQFVLDDQLSYRPRRMQHRSQYKASAGYRCHFGDGDKARERLPQPHCCFAALLCRSELPRSQIDAFSEREHGQEDERHQNDTDPESDVLSELFCESPKIDYVSCSCAPRSVKDSYMPCFLVGESAAKMLSAACDIPCYTTSHQCGHILAALYSCDRLDLAISGERFIALHVSGGTTDLLLCKANEDKELDISQIGGSLDLKAGQAVDRTGVMLGLDFPCGQELEKLALKSSRSFKLRPVIKGTSCCLSGLENLCRDMLDKGEDRCDIARFCLEYIGISVRDITRNALDQYGQMPFLR